MAYIHFYTGDDRFCGTREICRQFTLDPNEVTCPACQDHDCLELSPQGKSYVDELNKATSD